MMDDEHEDTPAQPTAVAKLPWYRRVRWWGWTLIGVLVALLALVGAFAVQAMQVVSHEKKALNAVVAVARHGDLSKLDDAIATMRDETVKAESLTRTGMFALAGHVPGLGPDIRCVQEMTALVHQASTTTVPAYAKVVEGMFSEKLVSGGHIEVQPIIEQRPALKEANQRLRLLATDYHRIERPNIPLLAKYYDMGSTLLQQGVKYADLAADDIVPNLPLWLGYKDTQTYAILVTSPAEVRASSGLVGAIGTVSLKNGTIKIGDFLSNTRYWHDGNADLTLDEQRIYHDEGPLHMTYDVRDITNYPDVEDIAKQFRTIWTNYHKDKPVALDGVVIADPLVVQALVKALGDVTLPDGRVLTGSNTADFLFNGVYQDYPYKETDKYFGIIADACVKRLMGDLNAHAITSLASSMDTLIDERHLSMYSFNEDLQKLVVLTGLTQTEPRSREYPEVGIYLTQQNPSKLDYYVKRTTKVTRIDDCDSTRAKYHVEYTLTNTLTEDEANKLSFYIRGTEAFGGVGAAYEKILFYPPAGGSLSDFTVVSGPGGVPVSDTINRNYVFRTVVRLWPGESVTYGFDVTAPPRRPPTPSASTSPPAPRKKPTCKSRTIARCDNSR
ncbi:MAG: DUF4012 domain-containing protein [Bifidobacterium sp.]|nr:DUF4012 domain-containing protein [Bifidobacterium sp.]